MHFRIAYTLAMWSQLTHFLKRSYFAFLQSFAHLLQLLQFAITDVSKIVKALLLFLIFEVAETRKA
jgi:hypothetical protein